MKKSILYLFVLSVAFFSCQNKDDTVFEESADARLNAALASYEKQLVEAPNGWNAVIYPAGGGSYGFFIKFNDQNRVVMYSDFSDSSATTAKESSYRLKALQTPSLIFDTYSYLHVLSDPNPEVNNGGVGVGLQSDFEFSIFPDSVKAESITLVGRMNESRLVLTKASAAQETAYNNGSMGKAVLFNNIVKYPTYFKRVTLGNVTYEITFSPDSRTIKLTWLEGTAARTFTTNYYYTGSGLVFTSPLVNGSQTITGFSNITWNASTVQLAFSAGGVTSTVASAIRPIANDVAAPRRWWQAPVASGNYWQSYYGFTVNGVQDAFKITELTSDIGPYYRLAYYSGFNSRYDLFAPFFLANNAVDIDYGWAPRATFTTDGRVVFTPVGTLLAVPTSGPAFNTVTLLYEANGFYLVQTSPSSYDMVSAKDAKSWISWF